MNKLEIQIRSKPLSGSFREITMTLKGALNPTTTPKFGKELTSLLETKPQRIILETAAIEHMHGEVFEILGNAYKEQARHQCELLLVNKHQVVDSIQIEKTEIGGVHVVKLAGHIDIRGVGHVEDEFLRLFEVPNRRVMVDFSAADSLSSLGIRMLFQGIKNASAKGGRILILNPTLPVAHALEVAGLGQFIARGDEHEIAEGFRQ